MLRTPLIILSLLFVNLTNSFAEEDLSFLKENMPYIEARKLLLDNGWAPYDYGVSSTKAMKACLARSDEYCVENIKSEFCVKSIQRCTDYPEIRSISGDGYASFEFSLNGKKMIITTYGDILRLYTNEGEPYIVGWGEDK